MGMGGGEGGSGLKNENVKRNGRTSSPPKAFKSVWSLFDAGCQTHSTTRREKYSPRMK